MKPKLLKIRFEIPELFVIRNTNAFPKLKVVKNFWTGKSVKEKNENEKS